MKSQNECSQRCDWPDCTCRNCIARGENFESPSKRERRKYFEAVISCGALALMILGIAGYTMYFFIKLIQTT